MTDTKYKAWQEEWSFRQVFVKIEKEKRSSIAIVTNDMMYVDSFPVNSENEADFMDECKNYLESERFKDKLQIQRGWC